MVKKAGRFVMTAGLVFVSCVLAISFGAGNATDWKRASLLDSETQSRLKSTDEFFYELFKLPDDYKSASASDKKKLEKQWVMELSGGDSETARTAAANLGMVRSKGAARFLQKTLADPPKDGRLRWVCTRSLALTGGKSESKLFKAALYNLQFTICNCDYRYFYPCFLAQKR